MARPPELIDDIFGEILLRLPPDDPACLIRVSLVCKPWRRLLSDPAFLHRYRAFHGAPPLLGFFRNFQGKRFVATTAPSPIAPLPMAFEAHEGWMTMDCRHGRALHDCFGSGLVVWDPSPVTSIECPLPENRVTTTLQRCSAAWTVATTSISAAAHSSSSSYALKTSLTSGRAFTHRRLRAYLVSIAYK